MPEQYCTNRLGPEEKVIEQNSNSFIGQRYPLTHQQKSIWYMEKLYPDTSIGVVAATFRIKGTVDLDLIETALNLFIERNDALRLRITEENGEPVQYVSSYEPICFDRYEYTTNEELYRWDEIQSALSFQLTDAPLFYFGLIRVGISDAGFYMRLHHLISDAWTMSMIVNQVAEYYAALQEGRPVTPAALPSYTTYIESETKYLTSKRFENDKEYWEEKFENWQEVCTLKDRKKSGISSRAKRRTLVLPQKLSGKIHDYCQEKGVSEFSLFIAAVSMYLNRVAGKENIVLGTTLLNRTNAAEKNTAGMFASLGVPLCIPIRYDMNFDRFVELVSKEILSALRHQKYPYDKLLRYVREKQKSSDNLFDIVLTYQNSKLEKELFSGNYISRWHFNGHQIESLLINLNAREQDGLLIVDYDYLVDLYCTTEIDFIHQHIINLLWHALDNPMNEIEHLNMLSEMERKKILYRFNDTQADYPADKTMPQLLDEQTVKTPDNIAVACGGRSITYRELKDQSDRLAVRLQELGVSRDSVVGLAFYRSIEMVVAIWGVMKAGGAYLPIDPNNPPDRADHMLTECGTKIVLTHHAARFTPLSACTVLNLDEPESYAETGAHPKDYPNPGDLAYIIYTSGSTGKPKGAMLEHRGLVNRLWWMQRRYPLTQESVILQKTPYTFDVSVWELMWWAVTGASVYMLAPDGEKDPSAIIDAIKSQRVTTMHFVPSMLNVFLQYLESSDRLEALSGLRQVFASGEALGLEHVRRFNRLLNQPYGTELYNLYGPTEATVDVSYFDCSPEVTLNCVPIGRPIDNTRLYILDSHLNLLPIGIPGELYIGGVQLARGYIGQPELTKDRFLPDPYMPGERIYKTGDLARWFAQGDIEYLGRLDHQLKIRGFRVELGEIENRLVQHKAIREAVVIGIEYAGQKHLCAYYVAEREIAARDLRGHIQRKLPEYMVPSFFVRMPALPISANGKVDRKALPLPLIANEKRSYSPPSNTIESRLCEVAEEILKLDQIGIDDNLFELGADSLSVIAILAQIYDDGLGLSAADFYSCPNIRELAAKASGLADTDEDLIEIETPIIPLDGYENNADSGSKGATSSKSLGDVLLTGSTGFLGAHLLYELLTFADLTVYCLVRAKDDQEAANRLEENMRFYFGEEIKPLLDRRVRAICGDISQPEFGMTKEDYIHLGETVNTVIHSAAIVKYFGHYDQIRQINVEGTQEVIEFCKCYHCLLGHVSTDAITGNYLVEQNVTGIFTERDFYIGQNYKGNVYVRSKFEAENRVLRSIREDKLSAVIFRMGNITGRDLDGKFQPNITENAFYAAIKEVVVSGMVSDKILSEELEFSPVDSSARAIILLLCSPRSEGGIFHLMNPKTIPVEKLISEFSTLGIFIRPLTSGKRTGKDDIPQALTGGSVYLMPKGELTYGAPIRITADYTVGALEKLGFDWPEIDHGYLGRILDYMRKNKFLE
jgi:amino acid adenylation domain-containing protein/thioester reductase-like protein